MEQLGISRPRPSMHLFQLHPMLNGGLGLRRITLVSKMRHYKSKKKTDVRLRVLIHTVREQAGCGMVQPILSLLCHDRTRFEFVSVSVRSGCERVLS